MAGSAAKVVISERQQKVLRKLSTATTVAKRLVQLVSPSLDELPPDGTVLPSVVTHADLASLCGGSRENVTRILSEFQRRGLVERTGHRYVLKKVDALLRVAGL